jgi:TatD DNase family protein
MLDAHCHLDLYADPTQTAADAEKAGVFIVFVTNLPSAFDAAYPHTLSFKKVRTAVGLHPLSVNMHTENELRRFKELVPKTSFIGESGLDFSREGFATRERQLTSFELALNCLENKPKFVTIHSRQAESTVLDLLEQEYSLPVVFHWYSGTLKNLERAANRGHFFSINPAMTWSKKGRIIIEEIPHDRVLTESDGPFIDLGGRQIVPADIHIVESVLAEMWETDALAVRSTVMQNFQRLMEPLRRSQIFEALDLQEIKHV